MTNPNAFRNGMSKVMNRASRLILSGFWAAFSLSYSGFILADEQGHSAHAEASAAGDTAGGHGHDSAAGDGGHGEADHGEAGHGEAGHGEGAHPTGVPGFDRDLALWSLVVFGCFLFVLKKAAWAPLIEGLDKREAGIRRAIGEAEENQRKSQAMLAEYDQKLKAAEQTVQAMVAEAKRDAERTSQDLIAAAQKEVTAIKNRARDEIQQAKDSALAEVFTSINSQVISATEHVLGRALNTADQDRFVQEALSGISR